MTSRYAHTWEFVKNEKAMWNVPSDCAWLFETSRASKPAARELIRQRRGGQSRDYSRARQRARSNGS
eukprot:4117452-Pyramimonas_sp.AAC.1